MFEIQSRPLETNPASDRPQHKPLNRPQPPQIRSFYSAFGPANPDLFSPGHLGDLSDSSQPAQLKSYFSIRDVMPRRGSMDDPPSITQQPVQLASGLDNAEPNHTGIPTPLKTQMEASSGLSLSDVEVHYNSDRPAQLQALAYTQGNQVYIGPGQERHLPHELGHVIQQKQGLVRPTTYIAGAPVNEDLSLERQADEIPRNIGSGFTETVVQRKVGLEFQAMHTDKKADASDLDGDPLRVSRQQNNIIQKKGRAMVALKPIEEQEPIYDADGLQIDTIKLEGRFNTGLEGGREGDHTIADVVNKKFQKVMVRDTSVMNTLTFYIDMLQLLISENNNFFNNTPPDQGVFSQSSSQIVAETEREINEVGIYDAAKLPQMREDVNDALINALAEIKETTPCISTSELIQQAKKVLEQDAEYSQKSKATKKLEKLAVYNDLKTMSEFRINFEKRLNDSNTIANNTLAYIQNIMRVTRSVGNWRKYLEHVIFNYNEALAKGALTTSPMATGGAGEARGKDSIRENAIPKWDETSYLWNYYNEIIGHPSISECITAFFNNIPIEQIRELTNVPTVGQILDMDSAHALVLINEGRLNVPNYLEAKTAVMTTKMQHKYWERKANKGLAE